MARTCSTPLCDNEIPDNARATTVHCQACRSSAGYWKKRPVKAMLYRRERLKFFGARLGMFIDRREKKS